MVKIKIQKFIIKTKKILAVVKLLSILTLLVISLFGIIYYINLGLVQRDEESPFEGCDLNTDGVCDEMDEQIFADAFGKCRGDPGYNFYADIDGDGCVVTNDEHMLFPKKSE